MECCLFREALLRSLQVYSIIYSIIFSFTVSVLRYGNNGQFGCLLCRGGFQNKKYPICIPIECPFNALGCFAMSNTQL